MTHTRRGAAFGRPLLVKLPSTEIYDIVQVTDASLQSYGAQV